VLELRHAARSGGVSAGAGSIGFYAGSFAAVTVLLLYFGPIALLLLLRSFLRGSRGRYVLVAALVSAAIPLAFAVGALAFAPMTVVRQAPAAIAIVIGSLIELLIVDWAAVIALTDHRIIEPIAFARQWTRATQFAVCGFAGAIVGAAFAVGAVTLIFGQTANEAQLPLGLAAVGATSGGLSGVLLPSFLGPEHA